MAGPDGSVVTPIGLPKHILVATPEDIEKYRGIPGTIIRPALLEGKVLYERPA